MLKSKTPIDFRFTEADLDVQAPSYVYHELDDGRLVPVEMGGLVELALYELNGKLVAVNEEPVSSSVLGLN